MKTQNTILLVLGGILLANIIFGLYTRIQRQKNYMRVLSILMNLEDHITVLRQILVKPEFAGELDVIGREVERIREFVKSHTLKEKSEWKNLTKSLELLTTRLRSLVAQAKG